MSSKRKILWTLSPLLVVGVVLAMIFLNSQEDHTSSPATESSVIVNLPPPRAGEVKAVLNGADKQAQAALVAAEFRGADWSAADVVPEGMTLELDENSFTPRGVVASQTGRFKKQDGSIAQEFLVWWKQEDGRWVIMTFEER